MPATKAAGLRTGNVPGKLEGAKDTGYAVHVLGLIPSRSVHARDQARRASAREREASRGTMAIRQRKRH
jgi:hypothetical protein